MCGVKARTRVQTVAVFALLLSGGLTGATTASAQEPVARLQAPRDGYSVSLEAYEHYATRRDFTSPVFLFQQPVEEIRAHELGLRLNLELELLLGLGLGVELPFVHRRAAVRYAPALISLDESTPATTHELSGTGISDPALSLRYRLLAREALALTLALGVRFPGDDNPGAAFVPERLPLGTGQREWFLEAALGTTFELLKVELDYHFGYHPGDAATYLVRQIGGSQIASGVLGDFFSHRAKLRLIALPKGRFSVEVAPSFSIDENPPLVEQDRELAFLSERARYEVGLEGRLHLRLGRGHALELFYEHTFLDAHEEDPFFPIVIPARGFGIGWRVTAP
jgi:hypothetical protein